MCPGTFSIYPTADSVGYSRRLTTELGFTAIAWREDDCARLAKVAPCMGSMVLKSIGNTMHVEVEHREQALVFALLADGNLPWLCPSWQLVHWFTAVCRLRSRAWLWLDSGVA